MRVFNAILLLSAVFNLNAKPILFEKDIRPILKAHCFHCHGEEKLTFKRAGQEKTLTDGQKARVVKEILA